MNHGQWLGNTWYPYQCILLNRPSNRYDFNRTMVEGDFPLLTLTMFHLFYVKVVQVHPETALSRNVPILMHFDLLFHLTYALYMYGINF